MAPTNLIVNGTFDAGSAGWTGTDLETGHTESAYLGNGSRNRVAELDGRSGQTTVMEQSFEVTNPQSTELTFDSALRTASNPNAGSEGFTVEILDGEGAVIATTTVVPTTNAFTSFSLPVTFSGAGTYSIRLTEVGPNDSLGAIVDNVSLMICSTGATAIKTPWGKVRARDIRPGDMVMTQRGPKPVRWVGRRQISLSDMSSNPKYLPVKISAGALAAVCPPRIYGCRGNIGCWSGRRWGNGCLARPMSWLRPIG